jgi:hypothetical protein
MSQGSPTGFKGPSIRLLEIILGVLILVAGLFYLFVGVPGIPTSGSSHVDGGKSLVVSINYPYSLYSTVDVTIHWNSSTPVFVIVRSCGSDTSCAYPSQLTIANGSGSSGSFTFSAFKGTSYAVTPSNSAQISYSGSTPYPYFYLCLPAMVIGPLLVLLGVFYVPKTERGSATVVGGGKTRGVDETVELEGLLKDVKARGIVAVLACPSCKTPIKVTGDTNVADLKNCASCNKQIDIDDLVDLLTAVLN